MEYYWDLALRVFIALMVVLLFFRITGKTEVGKLGLVEVIVSVMVADLAVRIIHESEVAVWLLALPIALLTGFQLLFSYLTLKSEPARKLVDGKAVCIIKNGEVLQHKMKEQNLNMDELMSLLRQKDIWDLREVYYAQLEIEGNISVLPVSQKQRYSLPLIQDGVVQLGNLKEMGLSEDWLDRQLIQQDCGRQDVFYLSYVNDELYLVRDELKQ